MDSSSDRCILAPSNCPHLYESVRPESLAQGSDAVVADARAEIPDEHMEHQETDGENEHVMNGESESTTMAVTRRLNLRQERQMQKPTSQNAMPDEHENMMMKSIKDQLKDQYSVKKRYIRLRWLRSLDCQARMNWMFMRPWATHSSGIGANRASLVRGERTCT